MRIQNVTRQRTLATHAKRAHSYSERLMGLMFQKSVPDSGGLLLEPESSIHTFFMRFPIDVLYLDRERRVLRAVRAMPAYRLGPVYTRGCAAILELPAGVIEATGTEAGDQLQVDDSQ